jgi:two-component system, LytTR family, sensor kinase
MAPSHAAAGPDVGGPSSSLAPQLGERGAALAPLPARLWLIILAGCIVAGVLDAGQSAVQGLIDGGAPAWNVVIFQGSEWLFLGALTPITYLLGQRFPVRRPHVGRALVVHATGAALLCIGWALMGVMLRRALSTEPGRPFGAELASWTLTSVPWSFFMYFALLGTVHAFAYWVEARNRALHAAQLSGQLAEARLAALRAQLQPHFLFNTLNAITVLVRDRRGARAVRMLDLLSELLRQLLRRDQPHEIPLGAELQLVRRYLEIEQVRFSDRLHVDFAVEDAALAAAVPSFLLQPLVENALRHGLAEQSADARVEIGAHRVHDALELWVRDNGSGIAHEASPGVGLDNTRARLAALYGEQGVLTVGAAEGGGTVARVRLPWHSVSAVAAEASP